MARMNAASTDLASTEAAQLCDDPLRACAVSAIHLEMRDDYTPGDSWFRAWRRGDREEFERQLTRPWLPVIREITGRGVAVRRLRVVSEPVVRSWMFLTCMWSSPARLYGCVYMER